ncbi:MAG: hypothetical protein QGH68_06190, partial [SAR324 cluster bacterium]|nr:hypothetical protein [SAR324 cluster bacterium]
WRMQLSVLKSGLVEHYPVKYVKLIHKKFTLILNQQGLLNSVFRLTPNALLYKNTGTIHADIKLGK